ncbi:MAG: MFS transporter, partial [Methanobacterium sp.]
LIMNFTIGGVVFVIPVYLQGVIGANPLMTGLALIPMSVGIFVMSFTAGKVATRFQARYILAAGFLAALAGSIYLSFIFNPQTTILNILPGVLFLGIGMGIVFPHSANVIFNVARGEQQPDASGVLNTGVNLGSALGTAILGVILILGSFGTLSAGAGYDLHPNFPEKHLNITAIDNYNYNLAVTGVITNQDDKKSNAMRDSFNVVSILLIVGLISSLLIPKKIHKPCEQGVTTHF